MLPSVISAIISATSKVKPAKSDIDKDVEEFCAVITIAYAIGIVALLIIILI